MRNIELTARHVKPVDLMHATRQLSAFLQAGIPIFTAIAELADETDSTAMKRVFGQIAVDLRSGYTLTQAVSRFPKDFPHYYAGVLQSAEATGHLDTVLDQLADYMERDLDARRKVKSVMTYPAIVAGMSIVTIIVLMSFVLPQFTSFFEQMDVELPPATRALIAASNFFMAWWWLILLVAVALVIAYVLSMRRIGARRVRDRIMLRMPGIGPTIRCAMIERLTRILASLVDAGISLPEAVQITSRSLHNVVFEDSLERARIEMIEGAGLAGPLARTGLLPGMASQMMRVGEETGTLDRQLRVAADYYAKELDHKIKKLSTMLEPTVVVIMGAIVGFVAIALVSAMYGVFKAGDLQ